MEPSRPQQSTQNHRRRERSRPKFDPCEYAYSAVYEDDVYYYRHVIAPPEYRKYLPQLKLLTEKEVFEIGIHMTPGWEHYEIHRPEPYIFLFRRKKQGIAGDGYRPTIMNDDGD